MKHNVIKPLLSLLVPMSELHLDPANTREGHDIQGIANSLVEFGQRKPIVVNANGRVEAGNGTFKAARDILGWTHIAAVRMDDDSVTAARFAIADNLLGDKSRFSNEALSAVLNSLDEPETIPGADEDWLELVRSAGEEEAPMPVEDVAPRVDKAAELQEVWGVADGDIWQAGPHYVICGDCREPETWQRLLVKSGHSKVNGVFTSPPYAEQRKEQYGGVPVDEYVEWWDAVQSNVRGNLTDDGSFFVNIKPHCENGERVLYVFDLVLAMKRRWAWRFVDELCWKHNGYPGKWSNRLKNFFEPVYHFSVNRKVKLRHENVIQAFQKSSHAHDLTIYDGQDNAPAKTNSPFRQRNKKSALYDGALPSNVIVVSHSATASHTGAYQAASFPVALPDFFIRAYSDPGDVWIDPFLGSGTTIVAAHQTDGGQRVGLGIEKLPKYVSVCLERFVKLGLEPVRL